MTHFCLNVWIPAGSNRTIWLIYPGWPHIQKDASMVLDRRQAASLIGAAVSASLVAAPARAQLASQVTLENVDTWAYQLQNIRVSKTPPDGFDILVVDYSRNGKEERALTATDVERMRHRDGDHRRIILAYLSIGEAETYRYYWKPEWLLPQEPQTSSDQASSTQPPNPDTQAPLAVRSPAAPAWLDRENPQWRGNFLVRYWDPAWQAVIFGSPDAYLDKIIAAGFDGIYVDKIDSNDDWEQSRPTARREMADFVKAIAKYARQKAPPFKVVAQNAEELLELEDYRSILDGIAKEDLLFGGATRKDGEPNPESEISASVAKLKLISQQGGPVLVVEYLGLDSEIEPARQRILSYGFVPFFATRALDGIRPSQPPPLR